MPDPTRSVPRIVQLADQIRDDIRLRGLSPGDSYDSTVETARRLGVSTTLANRALQVLVKRQVLERRQRKGTFVAQPPELGVSPLSKIHLLVDHGYLKSEGVLTDGVLVGLQGEFPSAQFQFNFLPPRDEQEFVEELIRTALRSTAPEGFVLTRSSLTVQRAFESSALPTVVFGTRYPSIRGLPWIDRDHRQAAFLLTSYLLQHGVRRVAVLVRSRVLPGDHTLLDAVQETATAAGLRPRDVVVRCLPPDRDAIQAAATALLEDDTTPIGFLCRSEPLARGVARAVSALGLEGAGAPRIVAADVYGRKNPLPGQAFTQPLTSPETIGVHIARLLGAQASGGAPDPDHEILPVRLESTGTD